MNLLQLIGRSEALFEHDIARHDRLLSEMVSSSRFLVIGGAGSIGQAVTREIFKRKPKVLHVVDISENNMVELVRDVRSTLGYIDGDFSTFAIDCGAPHFDALMKWSGGYDYVLNLSALKHVRSEKDPFTLMRMVDVNVLNTNKTIDLAKEYGAHKYFCVSTDKAASPINLYGATKLLSDKLFVAANNTVGKQATRYAVVRYGNVVGSRGSVVPLFQKLVADGVTELPITDPRMTRFWITLQEGVDFVLRAFERMYGGELFVPKIPSARITDLAEALGPGLPQRMIGIRPGEKLHEMMISRDDSLHTLEFQDHYVITPSIRFVEGSDFASNGRGEQGSPVTEGFKYVSDSNPQFLSVEEIRALSEQKA